MSNDDDIYVRKDEFHKEISTVKDTINKNDRKQSESLNQLKIEFAEQTTLQKQTVDEQKETNSNIKNLTNVMTKYGAEMTEIKYTVKGHDDDIKAIQGTLSEKQKGGVQIIVAIIAGASTIIAAAIAFSQVFF